MNQTIRDTMCLRLSRSVVTSPLALQFVSPVVLCTELVQFLSWQCLAFALITPIKRKWQTVTHIQFMLLRY